MIATATFVSEPPSAIPGALYFNTGEERLYGFDGNRWVPFGSAVDQHTTSRRMSYQDCARCGAPGQPEVCVYCRTRRVSPKA